MANEFVARNGLIALDNSQVSGSLKVTNGITGSLFGTASWAQNAVSSSYVLNAVSASFSSQSVSSSFSSTASLSTRAIITASAVGSTITFTKGDNSTFGVTLTTAIADTASYVLSSNVDGPLGKNSVLSSSFAATASSADNFTVRGTLTAQTIVAQVITSSTNFVTGSTRFGSLMSNTHVFTGSVGVTGSFSLIGGNVIVQSDENADGVSALTVRNNIGTQVLSLGSAGGIIMSNSARITNNSTALAPYIEVYNNSDGNLKIQSSTSYNLILQPDSRNVGIGTLTPNAKLDVSGSTLITGSLNVSQGITGSLFGTASFAVSASWAPTAGTTVFPFTGSAIFTGSMSLTGSFSVTGSVTASSFVITNRTGSTEYTYGYLSTAASSINVISSVSTGSFRAAFYNYVATSGSNARAGQISSVWLLTTCSFAEYITTDIGTTAQVDMYVRISGSFVQLMASSSANWIIDTSVNLV